MEVLSFRILSPIQSDQRHSIAWIEDAMSPEAVMMFTNHAMSRAELTVRAAETSMAPPTLG